MSTHIAYHSFNSQKADKGWENFPYDVAVARNDEKKDGESLTPVQEYIRENLSDLSDSESREYYLIGVDLLYGGVPNTDSFEGDSTFNEVLGVIIRTFGLKHEDGVPLPSELVGLYVNWKKEDHEKLHRAVIDRFYNGVDTGNTVLYGLDFLQSLKPVASDLKANPGSVLVLFYEGGDIEPKSAEKLLSERVKRHTDEHGSLLS